MEGNSFSSRKPVYMHIGSCLIICPITCIYVPRKPGICANLGLPCANPEFQVCRANLESRDVRRQRQALYKQCFG